MTRIYKKTDKSSPEYRREYQRQYYLAHKDKAAAYQREYNRKHKLSLKTSKRTPLIKYDGPKPIAPQLLVHLPIEKVLRVFQKVQRGEMVFESRRV